MRVRRRSQVCDGFLPSPLSPTRLPRLIGEASGARARRGLHAGLVASALLLAAAAGPAQTATFTVNSVDDGVDGAGCDAAHCSLREAILAANAAPGADRITFDIPGVPGEKRIVLSTALPAITGDLEIDGYSQSGALANTRATGGLDAVLIVHLQGDPGLNPLLDAGLTIDGPDVTIRGLALTNFDRAIDVRDASATNVTIAGNFIGTDTSGTATGGGHFGILLTRAPGVTIGGSRPADRNLIAGHAHGGIRVDRADSTPLVLTVQGNLIGTQKDGQTEAGNYDALVILQNAIVPPAGDAVLIGGDTWSDGNVIAGSASGLTVLGQASSAAGSSFTVRHNSFGTAFSGGHPLPFTHSAINFGGAFSALIRDNVITNAGAAAIRVTGSRATDGRGVEIRGNQIFGNAGLGIDLGNDGRTANDAGDVDDGANALLNYPIPMGALIDPTSGIAQLRFAVDAEPDTRYRIEVFALGASAPAEGYAATTPVYDAIVQTDGNGQADIERYAQLTDVAPGDHLSATLTNEALGYTSEISPAVSVLPAAPVLDGRVTLTDGVTPVPFALITLDGAEARRAITGADGRYLFFNLQSGSYTVTVAAMGYTFPTPQVAVPALATRTEVDFVATLETLPAFTVNVTHDHGDGACTPAECTLREAIDAANGHPGPDTVGFAIPGDHLHTIEITRPLPDIGSDLLIDGYTQPGARPNTRAAGGLDTVLRIAIIPSPMPGSDLRALQIAGDRAVVRGLAIDGFQTAISVHTTSGTRQVAIEGSFLGSAPDGRAPGLPGQRGVAVQGNGTASVRIGGLTPAARNLIAGNGIAGVEWSAHDPAHPLTLVVQGNLLGLDATGQAALVNQISLLGTSGFPTTADIIRIGGDEAGAANVIAAEGIGIRIDRAQSADAAGAEMAIVRNIIGVAADGTTIGSMAIGIAVCGALQGVVRANTIADVVTGVALCPTPAGYVTITENSLFNIYQAGIDLATDGPTPNDPGDTDSGPNDLQNFPQLTAAVESPRGVDVTGTLDSLPRRSYRIELFRTGPGWMAERDARALVGTLTVETDAAGAASFRHDAGLLEPDDRLVATATDLQTGGTSELSAAIAIAPLDRYVISGRLLRGTQPIARVPVALTGDRTQTVETDHQGYFDFDAVPATGSYQVTPSTAAWRFTPATAALANLQDHAILAFEASPLSYTRYFAEGASGPFWETSIALFNPTSTPVTADVTFMLPDGRAEQLAVPLTGPGHAVIDPSAIPALDGTTFATRVQAAEAVVASRAMRWGLQRELGAHAEQAVSEARTLWYFAEGATGCFDLFYQLANPNAEPAQVEVTFVRRAPEAPLVRRYTVAPHARHTIHANAEDGLAFAEVSAKMRVTNDQPIVAERAMYANCFGTTWRGGHDAAGSPAAATVWRMAEGATGSFFDLYPLLANFESDTAEVDVQYMLPDGTLIVKPYTVPGGSRVTIDVAGEAPQLANAAVSAYITSDNGVPIVAERAQWWPHGDWYEGHASAGSAAFSYEWHLAGAQVGGPHDLNGFVLIANTGSRAGAVTVTAVFDDGSTASLPEPVTIPKHSRTTIDLAAAFPQAKDRAFGLIVTSVGSTPAPIVVELSTYGDTADGGGRVRSWGASTNVLGTPVR